MRPRGARQGGAPARRSSSGPRRLLDSVALLVGSHSGAPGCRTSEHRSCQARPEREPGRWWMRSSACSSASSMRSRPDPSRERRGLEPLGLRRALTGSVARGTAAFAAEALGPSGCQPIVAGAPGGIPSAARMALTARVSSNGRSPGAAMIASTRLPSAARRTIAFSFSAHSPRSASAACAASMAAADGWANVAVTTAGNSRRNPFGLCHRLSDPVPPHAPRPP